MFSSTRQFRLVSVAILILLSGCVTLGPAFQPEAAPPVDKATIYVYRTSTLIGSEDYGISANGVPLAVLGPNTYFVHYAAPGAVEFSSRGMRTTSLTVDAKAGYVLYLKGSVGAGILVGQLDLVLVSKEAALKEIAGCTLVLKDDMPPQTIIDSLDRVSVRSDEGMATDFSVAWFPSVDAMASVDTMTKAWKWEIQGLLHVTDTSLTLVAGSDRESKGGAGIHIPFSDISAIEVTSNGVHSAVVIKRRDSRIDSFQVRSGATFFPSLVDRTKTQEVAELLQSKFAARPGSSSR